VASADPTGREGRHLPELLLVLEGALAEVRAQTRRVDEVPRDRVWVVVPQEEVVRRVAPHVVAEAQHGVVAANAEQTCTEGRVVFVERYAVPPRKMWLHFDAFPGRENEVWRRPEPALGERGACFGIETRGTREGRTEGRLPRRPKIGSSSSSGPRMFRMNALSSAFKWEGKEADPHELWTVYKS
jgi:hypothetical protein